MTKPYEDSYFIGYWQDERLFWDVRDRVAEECTLKTEYIGHDMTEMEQEMNGCNSVSLHVRRTDYVSFGIYPICGKEYYMQAVNYIKASIDNPVLYIFSDDLEWCRDNLTGLCGCDTIFVDMGEDYKDWYVMSRAKHNIIANSSFSFWAAYTNTNPGKIVCAPKLWVFDRKTRTNDVQGWVKL